LNVTPESVISLDSCKSHEHKVSSSRDGGDSDDDDDAHDDDDDVHVVSVAGVVDNKNKKLRRKSKTYERNRTTPSHFFTYIYNVGLLKVFYI